MEFISLSQLINYLKCIVIILKKINLNFENLSLSKKMSMHNISTNI